MWLKVLELIVFAVGVGMAWVLMRAVAIAFANSPTPGDFSDDD
jgi:hypothetical protein